MGAFSSRNLSGITELEAGMLMSPFQKNSLLLLVLTCDSLGSFQNWESTESNSGGREGLDL